MPPGNKQGHELSLSTACEVLRLNVKSIVDSIFVNFHFTVFAEMYNKSAWGSL
jgi:hypothetical protein